MPKFPDYQNKIWKWDFRPAGERSSTRKGWRLYAYVPDPKAPEPIPARAFLCYDKDEAPTGNHVKYVAGKLKTFLAETVDVKAEQERFRRVTNSNGEIVSLCYECYETVALSADVAEVEVAEGTHQCAVGDIAASGE
jgi:hypothetical protein